MRMSTGTVRGAVPRVVPRGRMPRKSLRRLALIHDSMARHATADGSLFDRGANGSIVGASRAQLHSW
jgi:hypothetical protein